MPTSSTTAGSASPGAGLTGLPRRLVEDRLLDEARARTALTRAAQEGRSFINVVVTEKWLTAARLAELASGEFGMPLVDLGAVEPEPELLKGLSERLLVGQHALPLMRRGRRLYIALSDPTNLQALDEFKFASGLATEGILVEDDKLGRAIEVATTTLQSARLGMDEAELDRLEVAADPATTFDENARAESDDAPMVRFVHKILLDAIQRGASDVHFEPYEHRYRVRYRLDGVLKEIASPPPSMGVRIAARLKVMARLDLAERRVPQDGRIKLQISRSKAIDFRVNTLPTMWGEKIVCRILDVSSAMMGIDALGFEPEQRALYQKALSRPQGMILVTGPTGSGKTVTMYTGLNILNTEGVNVSTAEDPCEINLAGINQVTINPKAGLGFAEALRAFLRQDPDVIMVGEIRDLETAEIAIKAAQTGHLVLSTLHTNDAPQTLTRLLNMGVPAYNVASSVNLIIAQRLGRKLCKVCRRPVDIPHDELLREGFTEAELNDLTLYRAVGCAQCEGGYKGRVGLYQVMPVSEDIARIMMEGGSVLQIAEQARREGVDDLRAAALRKVREGLLDLTEANRVTVD